MYILVPAVETGIVSQKVTSTFLWFEKHLYVATPTINVSIFNTVILTNSFSSTVALSPNSMRSPVLKNFGSQTTLAADGRSGDESLDEIVSVMMTPKTGNRLHVPREVLRAQVE